MRSGEQADHEGKLNIWSPKTSCEAVIELFAAFVAAKSCCKTQYIKNNVAVICQMYISELY